MESESYQKQGVQQTTSESEIFELLAFLKRESTVDTNDIYSHLLFFMLTKNKEEKFYYLRQPSKERDAFLAIVGLKLEKRLDFNKQIQKSWRISGWATDPIHLVEVFRATHDDGTIDWNADYIKLFLEGHQPSPPMITFLNQKNRRANEYISLNTYYLPIKEAINIQMICPKEVYVTSLDPCHAESVYYGWSAWDSSCVEDMALTITQLPSAGVFLKCNDELVSWAVCHPPSGGLNHLWTVEEHRRKGYAKLAAQYLSKRLAQSGHVPFVIIGTGNGASQQLFTSLGFQFTRKSHICYAVPNTPEYMSYKAR